jgi:hypothetical protein
MTADFHVEVSWPYGPIFYQLCVNSYLPACIIDLQYVSLLKILFLRCVSLHLYNAAASYSMCVPFDVSSSFFVMLQFKHDKWIDGTFIL